MALATIIRMEMAYPGIGILAGDSLQYLSVVTAHAVVMVFFMIMPLMFGAFANFLLPTQLGVHDVAFPRLNSAAFWFLPGGFVMLAQLICLDRRFQRMGCFNIREIQTLLQTKDSAHSTESQDQRDLVNDTILGIRLRDMGFEDLQSGHKARLFEGLSLMAARRDQEYFTSDMTQLGTSVQLTLNTSLVNGVHFFYPHSWTGVNLGNFQPSFSTNFSVWAFVTAVPNQISYVIYDFNFNIYRSLVAKYEWAVYLLDLCKWVGRHFDLNYLLQAFLTISSTSVGNVWSSVLKPFWSVILDVFTATSGEAQSHTTLVKGESLNKVEFVKQSTLSPLMDIDTYYSALKILIDGATQLCRLVSIEGLLYAMWVEVNVNTRGVADAAPTSVYEMNSKKFYSSQTTENQTAVSSSEMSSDFRTMELYLPLIPYTVKGGDYLPNRKRLLTPHLYTTIFSVTRNDRLPSSWFFDLRTGQKAKLSISLWEELFRSHIVNPSLPTDRLERFGPKTQVKELRSTTYTDGRPFDNFLSIFDPLWVLDPKAYKPRRITAWEARNQNAISGATATADARLYRKFFNTRWVALNALDQKLYRMLSTAGLQQRVSGNWRQLKFTREAWRCRLLAARHQKTLYRRYLNEHTLAVSLERNARDVLPGWAMITPFSARTRFTAIGKVDIGLMGIFLVLNSSMVSSANFLVTYRYLSTLNNRKMRDARSFFTEGVMVASWMMIAANPMLAIGILMLLSDRHWQTSFFDYSGGGDTVLFQHMFWFFGHPEVYVIMIPAFGFNNTILSFYLRKRVSARASLMYSMYTIAFLGFFVWGHHMYMVGLAHTTRMLFSTLTVMISVPAATKLMHWCVTLVNSSFWVELPFLFSLLFIFFFVSGGISGMAVAHTGMDILFHDSFYVIGHFHVMFAGAAMFASFGAFYFYFPAIFGVKFSRLWGYLHITYFLLGQLMTVAPMFWLGYSGMPRRILDYPAALGGWHAIVSAGHLLSVAGIMAFFIMIFDSLRQGRAATRNSFGVSRFNTRLNFYLYEVARTRHVQRRGWYTSRYSRRYSLQLNEDNYENYALTELTLSSYNFVLVKPKAKKSFPEIGIHN